MSDEELRQLIQSNARTIQGMLDQVAEDRLEREERNRQFDVKIAKMDEAISRLININEGVVRLLSSLDEDRPTVLIKLTTIENKVDKILERVDPEPS